MVVQCGCWQSVELGCVLTLKRNVLPAFAASEGTARETGESHCYVTCHSTRSKQRQVTVTSDTARVGVLDMALAVVSLVHVRGSTCLCKPIQRQHSPLLHVAST